MSTIRFSVECPRSQHLIDKLVDELLSVSVGTESLSERVSLLLEATQWRVHLDWPQEVSHLSEVRSASGDLVDDVLNAVDSELSEDSLDDGVVGKWDSSSVNLSVSSLVDDLVDVLSRWVSVGDEWLDHSEHVHGSLVELDEHSVVNLSQSEELEDLLGLGGKLVDTVYMLETRQMLLTL